MHCKGIIFHVNSLPILEAKFLAERMVVLTSSAPGLGLNYKLVVSYQKCKVKCYDCGFFFRIKLIKKEPKQVKNFYDFEIDYEKKQPIREDSSGFLKIWNF